MDLNDMAQRMWEIAEEKGLHDNLILLPLREATLIRLALVHTEVSEAAQVVKRHGVSAQTLTLLAEEIADTFLRLGDLTHGLGIDLTLAVERKLALNRQRPLYYGTPQERRLDGTQDE